MILIDKNFFSGSTLEVAKRLIGCRLRYRSPEGIIGGIINETEAYTEDDQASHAFLGKVTPRNRSMFKEAGHLYVYFIYGMYYCANIVTENRGFGSAVLLRSIIPDEGVELMRKNREYFGDDIKNLSNGPGKLCQAFGWDRSFDMLNIMDRKTLVDIYKPNKPPEGIVVTSRVGISKDKDLPWRFLWNEK